MTDRLSRSASNSIKKWKSADFQSSTGREISPSRRVIFREKAPSQILIPSFKEQRASFEEKAPSQILVPSIRPHRASSPSRRVSSLEESPSEMKWCSVLEDKKLVITSVSGIGRGSGSIIAFGTMNTQDVIFKISPPDRYNNSLSIERLIYKNIIPQLLLRTPHVVRYIDDFICTNFVASMMSLAKSEDYKHRYQAAQLASFLENKVADANTPIHILVIEKAKGVTLEEWLESALYNEYFTSQQQAQFTRDVSIQVAYTLEAMAKYELMHNDLHPGNIYVEQRENTYLYQLNGKDFYSPYFVRIYDFDHSFAGSLPRNTLLDKHNCNQVYECNKYTPKLDWFTYLDFYQVNSPGSISKEYFPHSFPRDEKFGRKPGQRGWRGKPCICNDDRCMHCLLEPEYLNKIISPVEYIQREI